MAIPATREQHKEWCLRQLGHPVLEINGEVTMSMTAANTANIKPGRYVFDVKSTDAANTVTRILEGIITINPMVTK